MKTDNKIEKKEPFRVPDGYFESLSDRVIISVKKKEENSGTGYKNKGGFRRIHYYLAVAAIVTGMAVISSVVIKLVSKPDNNFYALSGSATNLYELLTEEIDIYTIESEYINSAESNNASHVLPDDFSESMIIENLDETDINNL